MHRLENKEGEHPLQLRIGTDLMRVDDVSESIRRFGANYLHRVYTEMELDYCFGSSAEMPRRLAARFAAKEATLKVLRPYQHWLDWRDIEVLKAPGGWCELRLHRGASDLAQQCGLDSICVSLSHESEYAVAVVAATIQRSRA